MKILIDTDELVEFFGEGWDCYDICSKAELRVFLARFCKQKIEGEKSDKEQNKDGADDHTNNTERHLYFNNILFNSRNEAELVLKSMEERIKTVGFVTVADYYLFSLKPAAIESVYYDWGWRDMSGAHLFSWLDKGHLKHTLKLPNALPIKHN